MHHPSYLSMKFSGTTVVWGSALISVPVAVVVVVAAAAAGSLGFSIVHCY